MTRSCDNVPSIPALKQSETGALLENSESQKMKLDTQQMGQSLLSSLMETRQQEGNNRPMQPNNI
jgi:hypothetical protein